MDELQALRDKVEDLKLLLDVSRELGAEVALDRLLERIERAALRVLQCERATVFLYDADCDELVSKVATEVDTIRFSAKLGIAGQALTTGEIIHVPDAYADSRFNPEIDKKTGFKTRNMLTFPLVGVDRNPVGVLQVLNKISGPFDSSDQELAQTLSDLAGAALQRQMLLDQYAAKQKLEQDLRLARDIQQRLLPSEAPHIDGYDVAGWNKPADDTGGDCYDFIPLSHDRLGLLLSDATGHGIGPALVVSQCRAVIRALAGATDDLDTLMGSANDLLEKDLDESMFVTSFFGALDIRRHEIQYVAAGQAPTLIYSPERDDLQELSASGLPLAVMAPFYNDPADPIRLAPGDLFLLLTDGFYEWVDPDKEAFGIEGVIDVLRRHHDQSAADIIRLLYEAVLEHARGTPQNDDLTAIVLKRLK
jgi:phosphoserine phosphatase